uniref:non-specific serine/threonine protein kinase n=1 Tax=Erpetoichthys calabaricus TaxID=27687 RepID=A0A8C4T6A8_ERPCA
HLHSKFRLPHLCFVVSSSLVLVTFVLLSCHTCSQTDTDPEPIPRELAHLRRVCEAPSCPAIISLLDWLRDSSRVVLVMELPEPCVNLFRFIRQCGGALEEDQARRIFQQVLVAVQHCHARGVFHRDLKTLNILIQTSTEKAKVIDFGSSSSFHDGHYQSFHGEHRSSRVSPPECVQEKGYQAVPTTAWSLGVMLYHMVSGGAPINLPQDPIISLTSPPECRDLIQKCLAVNPEQRPTIEEIACHKQSLDGAMKTSTHTHAHTHAHCL